MSSETFNFDCIHEQTKLLAPPPRVVIGHKGPGCMLIRASPLMTSVSAPARRPSRTRRPAAHRLKQVPPANVYTLQYMRIREKFWAVTQAGLRTLAPTSSKTPTSGDARKTARQAERHCSTERERA